MHAPLPEKEIQARLLYACIVAGKSAKFADEVINRLSMHGRGQSPFDMIRRLIRENYLQRALELARSGNYGKLARCFTELVGADIDLLTVTPERLEQIHGIGPKTSRFFILWTRPDAPYAALDVHVLRWMRNLGYKAPRTTPTGRKYAELERQFLEEAKKRGKTPRELDAEIWAEGSGYEDTAAKPQSPDTLA